LSAFEATAPHSDIASHYFTDFDAISFTVFATKPQTFSAAESPSNSLPIISTALRTESTAKFSTKRATCQNSNCKTILPTIHQTFSAADFETIVTTIMSSNFATNKAARIVSNSSAKKSTIAAS